MHKQCLPTFPNTNALTFAMDIFLTLSITVFQIIIWNQLLRNSVGHAVIYFNTFADESVQLVSLSCTSNRLKDRLRPLSQPSMALWMYFPIYFMSNGYRFGGFDRLHSHWIWYVFRLGATQNTTTETREEEMVNFNLGKYDVNVFRQWISATQKCNFWSSVLAYTIQIFTCLRSVLGLVNLICCRWHKRHCHQLFISYVSPRQINHTSYSFADFPSELVLILIIVVAIIISLTILTIGIVCIFKR